MQRTIVLKSWRWQYGERNAICRAVNDAAFEMRRKGETMSVLTRLALLLLKRLLLCVTLTSGGPALAEPKVPPPQTILDSLPPLPPPTEQQLQRGRELLDKIVYVVENVPLTDAAAVMKVFGFVDLRTETYPTHVWVGPKGKSSNFAQPNDLVGTGFDDISVQPNIYTAGDIAIARLSGRLGKDEACISIHDVRKTFESRASRWEDRHTFVAGFIERPRKAHRTDTLVFELSKTRVFDNGSISFRFTYQTCAASFGLVYLNPNREIGK